MIKGLPEKLKELRARQKLSQKEVAAQLGVSASLISSYETGERTPSAEMLLALAYLYHCSTDYLLGRKDMAKAGRIDAEGLTEKQVLALRQLIDTMRENGNA